MQLIKTLNLGLKFLIEIFMLAAFAYFGWKITRITIVKYALPVLLLIVVILLWSRFAAPRSATRLPFAKRVAFGIVLFLLAAIALFLAGQPTLALVFAIIVLVCETGTIVWRQ